MLKRSVAFLCLAVLASAAQAGSPNDQIDGHWSGAGFDLTIDTTRMLASDTTVSATLQPLVIRARAGAVEMFEVGHRSYFAIVEGDQMRLTSTAFPGELMLVRLETRLDLRGTL